jgi:hypothetical protein
MMYDRSGDHMSGWGYGLMGLGLLVITGLVVFGVAAPMRRR